MSSLRASTTIPPVSSQVKLAGHHDPPFVEVGVPVRAVAAARTVGDQRDELPLVLDDPA